ncbi:unnamed protein product, partial [marine sediment metagenome]
AITAADPYDIIIVAAGIYNEDLWIDKSLTLLSESGAVSTIIDGTGIAQGTRQATVKISASDVVFGREGEGFTVKGGETWNLILTRELGLTETPTYENILIEGNILDGPCRPFASAGGAYTANLIGVTVSKNTLNDPIPGAYIDTGTDWRLIDNTLNGAHLTLTGSSTGIVSGNTFVGAGISIAQSSDFVINGNSFSGETWDGAYIHVWAPCDPTTFDATLNWWSTTDPEEIKDRILVEVTEVTVDFFPWALDEARTQFTNDATEVIVVDDDWGELSEYTPVTVDGTDYYIGVNAFATIQDGITAVAEAGTVNVAAGTYPEYCVIIDKALTVRSTDGALETIIDGTGYYVVRIQHSDVTFEGFTVTNPDYQGTSESAILIQNPNAPINNVKILDNIVTKVRSETGTPTVYGATGINLGKGPLSNIVISGNTITNIKNPDGSPSDHTCGINVWAGAENVLISNNDISDIKFNGIMLERASNVRIEGNSITECETGIRVEPFEEGAVSGLTINFNNIAGNTEYGVANFDLALLDATNNWWGTAIESQIAKLVFGNVDYSPWLDAAYPDGKPTILDVTNIGLKSGWNLISLPLIPEPEASSIETVLDGVDVNKVAYYIGGPEGSWLYYTGDLATSDLTQMQDGKGYWIDMNTAGALTIRGYELCAPPPAVPPSYNLVEGWNLIGFKSLATDTVAAYFGTAVTDTMEAMYGYDAATGLYTIIKSTDNLVPGDGCWLAVSADGTIYP